MIQQVHFDNQDNDLIKRNIEISNQEKAKRGIDNFGRKIKQQPTQQQGPINPQNSINILNNTNNNQNVPQQNQSGPIYDKSVQHDWKKFRDLIYQKNKRDRIKADKLRQQAFSDADEEEMMNRFNTGKLFDDNDD